MYEIIITSIASIVVAIIGGLFGINIKKQNHREEKSEQRATLRTKESRLSMKMMSASIELGIATAQAVKTGHANGEVTKAVEFADKAQHEYNSFLQGVTAFQVSK